MCQFLGQSDLHTAEKTQRRLKSGSDLTIFPIKIREKACEGSTSLHHITTNDWSSETNEPILETSKLSGLYDLLPEADTFYIFL